jgi:hypothetical protein
MYSISWSTTFLLFGIYAAFKYKAGKISLRAERLPGYEAALYFFDSDNHHKISVVDKELYNLYRAFRYSKDWYS